MTTLAYSMAVYMYLYIHVQDDITQI